MRRVHLTPTATALVDERIDSKVTPTVIDNRINAIVTPATAAESAARAAADTSVAAVAAAALSSAVSTIDATIDDLPSNVTIAVEDFGVTAGADATTALISVRTEARANPARVIRFAPSASNYQTRNPRLFSKQKDVRISAYGAKLKNVAVYGTDVVNGYGNGGDSSTLFVNGDLFFSYADSPPNQNTPNAPTLNPAYLIVTQAAGLAQFTCATAAEAANFVVGETVFVCGFIQQAGGYPPNLRFKEWRKVLAKNASTGVVTLDRPLLYKYDSRWYDQTMVIAYGNLVVRRRRESMRLRANQTWCETFIRGRGHEGSTTCDEGSPRRRAAYGRLETHGAQYVDLKVPNFGVVTPSHERDGQAPTATSGTWRSTSS
jgi:hypothetical protein